MMIKWFAFVLYTPWTFERCKRGVFVEMGMRFASGHERIDDLWQQKLGFIFSHTVQGHPVRTHHTKSNYISSVGSVKVLNGWH